MSYTPNNPNGQADSADSSPVVLSTEQEAIIAGINGNTSEIPYQTTQLDAIKTSLADIDTSTDQIEGKLDSIYTRQGDGSQVVKKSTLTATGNITTQNLVPSGTATANSAVELEVGGFGTVTIQITGTYTGALNLQFSNNGTNWYTSSFFSIIASVGGGTLGTLTGSGQTGMWSAATLNFRYVRITALSAVTGTASIILYASQNANAVTVLGSASNIPVTITSVSSASILKTEDAAAASGDNGVFILKVRRDALTVSASATGDYNESAVTKHGAQYVKQEERQKITYQYPAIITTASAATDIMEVTASSQKVVEIDTIEIWATATSAAVAVVDIIIRSTLDTGGTRTAVTGIKSEQADANATATVNYYTANPTTGTTVGIIKTLPLQVAAASGTSAIEKLIIKFGDTCKPPTLALGSTQAMYVNLRGASFAGGIFYVNIITKES